MTPDVIVEQHGNCTEEGQYLGHGMFGIQAFKLYTCRLCDIHIVAAKETLDTLNAAVQHCCVSYAVVGTACAWQSMCQCADSWSSIGHYHSPR